MSAVVLVLGPVAFRDLEVPSGISFGGRQRLAVHQLTDGRRIVDSLGPDESEISFTGAFTGEDATKRARLINFLRISGEELQLTWDVFFYTVVLSNFEVDYENSLWIPYRIVCTVVRDEAAAVVPSVVSLRNSLLMDLKVAASQGANLGLDFTEAQICLADPDATILHSTAFAAAQSSINAIQDGIKVRTGSIEATFQAAIAPDQTSPGSLLACLLVATATARCLAALTNASAYAGRAARNLLATGT